MSHTPNECDLTGLVVHYLLVHGDCHGNVHHFERQMNRHNGKSSLKMAAIATAMHPNALSRQSLPAELQLRKYVWTYPVIRTGDQQTCVSSLGPVHTSHCQLVPTQGGKAVVVDNQLSQHW